MIRCEISTEIKRPVVEVFAYADDPRSWPEWNSIIEEVTVSKTPLRLGTKIKQRGRLPGRRLETVSEVTEHVPNQKAVWKMDKPFPGTITGLYQAAGGSTRVTVIYEGEPGGFFKVGEPILARIVKKQFQAQLDTLKELLEARATAELLVARGAPRSAD